MIIWLIVFALIYILTLSFTSYLAKKEKNLDPKAFALGGGNLNIFLGVLTYSATLFSTFTLMGMPNFFRTHGVGAWIFLGVTDVAMAFVVIFIGLKVHTVFKRRNHLSIATLLNDSYQSKLGSYVFLFGIFIFLIPYMAIQIKGVSAFLEVASPIQLPGVYWSVMMLVIILTYSSVGGFKAIVYSDAIQGLILLIVVWLISYNCLEAAGGVTNLFERLNKSNPELLSVPGPQGLLSFQFLFSSFLAIIVMPITQPQLTTRLIAMKSKKTLRMMAPSVAFFVIAVILPATFMGMYGALKYSELSAQDFWNKIIITDQPEFLGALALVGILAAAMSTTDSQLFALGNEASIFLEKDKYVQRKTKALIFVFALASLIFSLVSTGGLVQLARLSFSGTAILAPMILLSIYSKDNLKLNSIIPFLTLISLFIFIYVSYFETNYLYILGMRTDIIIYAILYTIAFFVYWISGRKEQNA